MLSSPLCGSDLQRLTPRHITLPVLVGSRPFQPRNLTGANPIWEERRDRVIGRFDRRSGLGVDYFVVGLVSAKIGLVPTNFMRCSAKVGLASANLGLFSSSCGGPACFAKRLSVGRFVRSAPLLPKSISGISSCSNQHRESKSLFDLLISLLVSRTNHYTNMFSFRKKDISVIEVVVVGTMNRYISRFDLIMHRHSMIPKLRRLIPARDSRCIIESGSELSPVYRSGISRDERALDRQNRHSRFSCGRFLRSGTLFGKSAAKAGISGPEPKSARKRALSARVWTILRAVGADMAAGVDFGSCVAELVHSARDTRLR